MPHRLWTLAVVFMCIGAQALSGCSGAESDFFAQDSVSPGALEQKMVNNGGFETSGLSSWTVTNFFNPGLASLTPTTAADLGLTAGDNNVLTTAVSGSSLSQTPAGLTSGASLRYPLYGTTSAVINALGTNKRAASLVQNFVLTASDIDAVDGRLHVRFARAPVLQGPTGHTVGESPYYFINLINLSRNSLSLHTELHMANDDSTLWKPDPSDGNTLYSDWQNVDLLPDADSVAVGDTLQLTIVAAGCSKNGHFGELYVDGFGTQPTGLAIAIDGPQTINPNTSIDYQVSLRNGGSQDASNVVVNIPLPPGTTFVSIAPPPGVLCTTPAVGTNGTTSCTFPSVSSSSLTLMTLRAFVPTTSTTPLVLSGANLTVGGGLPLLGGSARTLIAPGSTLTDLVTQVSPIGSLCCDQNVGFRLTFSNSGPSNVVAATISDTLAAEMTASSWSCQASTGASCGGSDQVSGTGPMTFAANLAAGSQLSCLVISHLSPRTNSTITYAARIAAPAGITDSRPVNDTDSAFVNITNQPSCATNKQPNGTRCGTDGTLCLSGNCVDGLCCNTACQSQCMACDATSAPGICTAVDGHEPRSNKKSCNGFICSQGTCLLHCTSDKECATHFACERGICASQLRCGSDKDCTADTWCTPSGTCEAPNQQRSDEPNWQLEGAGAGAMGCSQGTTDKTLGLVMATSLVALWMRRRGRHLRATALFVTMFVLATALPQLAAAADDTSLTLSRMQLWGGHSDIWAVQGAAVPQDHRLGLMLYGNVAHTLVRVVSVNDHRSERGLIRYQQTADIGATLALAGRVELSLVMPIVWQQSSTAPFLSTQFGEQPHNFAQGDLRFAPKVELIRGEKFRLAVAAAATLPTGRLRSFVGNGNPTITPKMLLDFGHKHGMRLLLNLGFLLRQSRTLASTQLGSAVAYGAAGSLPFHLGSAKFAALLSAVGEVNLSHMNWRSAPLEAHAGVRWHIRDGLNFDLGAGTGLTNGIGSPRWRVLAGLVATPGHWRQKEAIQTMPVEPPARTDRDGDGIFDDEDACPDVFGVASTDPNLHGCPALPAPVIVVEPGAEPLIAVADILHFKLGKSSLTPEDIVLLDKIDDVLVAHPEASVSVDGHTDTSGSERLNIRLSKARAERVLRWLVEHGVDRARLVPRGFGPHRPRSNNSTRQGRALNRRVEFHILDKAAQQAAPSGH